MTKRTGQLVFGLDLALPDGEVPKAQLQHFLDIIPAEATISTDVVTVQADRPWESTRNTVTLHAQWFGPVIE